MCLGREGGRCAGRSSSAVRVCVCVCVILFETSVRGACPRQSDSASGGEKEKTRKKRRQSAGKSTKVKVRGELCYLIGSMGL